MFGLPVVALSVRHRATGPHLFAEAIATFGLVLVVFGVVRAGRGQIVPFAVGAYIAAGYWFTSSTSFANPAVTFARMLTNSFAGIAPTSVPGFVGLELLGGALGAACIAVLYPSEHQDAGDVLLRHEEAV
jgi:arsenate reductase